MADRQLALARHSRGVDRRSVVAARFASLSFRASNGAFYALGAYERTSEGGAGATRVWIDCYQVVLRGRRLDRKS